MVLQIRFSDLCCLIYRLMCHLCTSVICWMNERTNERRSEQEHKHTIYVLRMHWMYVCSFICSHFLLYSTPCSWRSLWELTNDLGNDVISRKWNEERKYYHHWKRHTNNNKCCFGSWNKKEKKSHTYSRVHLQLSINSFFFITVRTQSGPYHLICSIGFGCCCHLMIFFFGFVLVLGQYGHVLVSLSRKQDKCPFVPTCERARALEIKTNTLNFFNSKNAMDCTHYWMNFWYRFFIWSLFICSIFHHFS